MFQLAWCFRIGHGKHPGIESMPGQDFDQTWLLEHHQGSPRAAECKHFSFALEPAKHRVSTPVDLKHRPRKENLMVNLPIRAGPTMSRVSSRQRRDTILGVTPLIHRPFLLLILMVGGTEDDFCLACLCAFFHAYYLLSGLVEGVLCQGLWHRLGQTK